MILTTEQLKLLTRCVGGGPIDKASIVVFGNELGTAEAGTTEATINKFTQDWTTNPVLTVGEGFVPLKIGILPVNSTFLQCISRMALAIRHKEDRFFDSLTYEGRAFLNNYILNELYRTDTAVINLRPLPQSTEKHWDYSNISENDYHSLYNFMLRRPLDSFWKDMRVSILREAFEMAKNSLILGSGDKHNKRAFFELIFKDIKFEEVILENDLQIYVSKTPKIILSNYYSSYNGLGLDGLKKIYHFIRDNYLV